MPQSPQAAVRLQLVHTIFWGGKQRKADLSPSNGNHTQALLASKPSAELFLEIAQKMCSLLSKAMSSRHLGT